MSIRIINLILGAILAYYIRPFLISIIIFTGIDKTVFPYFASEQYLLKIIMFSCALSLIWSIATYKTNFKKVLVPTMETFFFLMYLSLTAGYYFYLNNSKMHTLGYFSIFILGVFFYIVFSSLYKMVNKTLMEYDSRLQLRTFFNIKMLHVYLTIIVIALAIYLFFPLRNLMR